MDVTPGARVGPGLRWMVDGVDADLTGEKRSGITRITVDRERSHNSAPKPHPGHAAPNPGHAIKDPGQKAPGQPEMAVPARRSSHTRDEPTWPNTQNHCPKPKDTKSTTDTSHASERRSSHTNEKNTPETYGS